MRGNVALTVISANTTRDTDTFGKMDPYVILKIGSSKTEHKTSVKDSAGKTPVWNEVINLDIPSTNEVLHVIVMDKDPVGSDLVGEVDIQLSDLCSTRAERDFTLIYKKKSCGTIKLKADFKEAASAPKALTNSSNKTLEVMSTSKPA